MMDNAKEPEIGNIWYCLIKGDPQPFVNLFRLLVSKDCELAAKGLLRELAQRIVDAPYRVAATAEVSRFAETGKAALRECLHDDPVAFDDVMNEALRIKFPRALGIRFSIAHMLILTTVCAMAVSFAKNITVVAVIYCCFLMLVLPLYARAFFRGFYGDYQSAKRALLIGLTVFIAFLIAMTRGEIRDFYPLPFWGIPIALFVAAAVVFKTRRDRFFSGSQKPSISAKERARDLVSVE